MPAAGVPERMPVEGSKVTPAGSVPATDRVGAGNPVATTVWLPALPMLKLAVAALVIAGASLTVSVNAWVASGGVPLLAAIERG